MQIVLSRYVTAFLFVAVSSNIASAQGDAAKLEFFERKVRPLLAEQCFNCHSANTKALGELRVDDRNGLISGGKSGPAVTPGQPLKSLLIARVSHANPKMRMPQGGQLEEEQVAVLTKWIKDGAVWPTEALPASITNTSAKYERYRKEHWAWQPLTQPTPPEVKDVSWPRSPIDRFVLAQLEKNDLKPVGDAERRSLIRRVTFDLTGLPPTQAEVAAYLDDTSSDAFAKVVDRLLASTTFGERWGRHWLDVARYGESTGSSRNLPYPHAWRYRDYVIDAFNSDKPFNQFLREQLAGDLLPAQGDTQRNEQLIATGFLALGVRDVNQRFKVRFTMDNIDEQIDTVSRAFLALTVSCARCHNHKFDPIPTTDYYGLAGIFASTDSCTGLRNKMGGGGLDYYDTSKLLVLAGPPKKLDAQAEQKAAKIKAAYEQAKTDFEKIRDSQGAKKGGPELMMARQKMLKIQEQFFGLNDPAKVSQVALGARDAAQVGDTEIRIRGEAEKLGPKAPRGFLSVLHVPGADPVNPEQSGRLELANWLASDKNPLTPRVFANRIWKHLFGTGLVASVDNFGVTGDDPSHPALLDFLANELQRVGWSPKKLIRSIVLSRTYQLGSQSIDVNKAKDPDNRLLWRHAPRRLDAEELRDTMLLLAGQLDMKRPLASVAADLKVSELRSNGPEVQRFEQEANASVHRSVYLPLLRGLTPRHLEVFDFAEQGFVTGHRDVTTVAPQALYLLNDPFVLKQSSSLADRLTKIAKLDDEGRIDRAYQLALGRAATKNEITRTSTFLAEYEAEANKNSSAENRQAAWSAFVQALLCSAEFRYVP